MQAVLISHYSVQQGVGNRSFANQYGEKSGVSDFYYGFVPRRKAGEVAGLSFNTAVLQNHMLIAKLNKVSGNKNNCKYTSYLLSIKAISDGQFYACLFLHTAGDRYKEF